MTAIPIAATAAALIARPLKPAVATVVPGKEVLADQGMHDTFEVAFVNGQQSPYLESRDGWTVDGIEYKVRTEFGVAALDYRAMFRNKGT